MMEGAVVLGFLQALETDIKGYVLVCTYVHLA